MDKLVIDASVAIKWFVVEPHTNEARRLLDSFQSGEPIFLAPDILVAEFANTIWKKQLFQGLTESDAKDILKAFQSLNLSITPAGSLIDTAYDLATKHRRSFYDALYLALSAAEDLSASHSRRKICECSFGFWFEGRMDCEL